MPCHQARQFEISAVATMTSVCETAYGPNDISQSAARTHSPKPTKSAVMAMAFLTDRGSAIRNSRNELAIHLVLLLIVLALALLLLHQLLM